MSWSELSSLLDSTLLSAMTEVFGFTSGPTDVQSHAIPPLLSHKDVVVEAVTGSGKTLAYLLPLLQMLYFRGMVHGEGIKAIIIAPTRELASQIDSVLVKFAGSVPGLSSAILIGGTDLQTDLAVLEERHPDILVACPGRLDDLLQRHPAPFARLRQTLELLILDEADRLLDLGFALALGRIIEALPKQRRTALYSATMSDAVDDLVRTGLRNPHHITLVAADESRCPSSLSIRYRLVPIDERLSALLAFCS